jgi:hypothetical protein
VRPKLRFRYVIHGPEAPGKEVRIGVRVSGNPSATLPELRRFCRQVTEAIAQAEARALRASAPQERKGMSIKLAAPV